MDPIRPCQQKKGSYNMEFGMPVSSFSGWYATEISAELKIEDTFVSS